MYVVNRNKFKYIFWPNNNYLCEVLRWACLYVCLYVCPLTYLKNDTSNLTKFSVRGSVLLWRQCNTLCTSGFVDDVMFAHKLRGEGDAIMAYMWSDSPGGRPGAEVWWDSFAGRPFRTVVCLSCLWRWYIVAKRLDGSRCQLVCR